MEEKKSKAKSDVELFLKMHWQENGFLKKVFERFALSAQFSESGSSDASSLPATKDTNSSKVKHEAKGMLDSTGLQKALLELGVTMESDQVKKLHVSMDVDENGGLDFEEFKRAVQQPATPLELWVAMLPIHGMLARSFPICGQGHEALRNVSILGDNDIETTVDVFSEALRGVLVSAQADLRRMFEVVDAKAADAAKGQFSAVSKFKTFKMKTGTVKDYFEGIAIRVGAPNPKFEKGIEDEHCVMWGFDKEFTTTNYGIRTTPLKEYQISTGQITCPENEMKDKEGRPVRRIQPIEELKRLKLSHKAKLTHEEILAVVLYSGPMFQVYNTILRQFPDEEYRDFEQGRNKFSTTIFVLQSAIIKIARVMRLPPGLELFRGLGGLAELPYSFYEADEHGCCGFLEYGFLSTTSHREIAVEYSGAGDGKPLPMVIQTRVSSVDRGACIKDFSQYPGEVEYLWPAGSYIESSGPSYSVGGGGGLLTMVPVRINANGKALTVEELLTQKKDMHLNAFRHMLAETDRDLVQIAKDEKAEDRLARDQYRVDKLPAWLERGGKTEWLTVGMWDETQVTFSVNDFLARIMQLATDVLQRHENLSPMLYTNDESFRHIVTEMLETRATAVGTLRGYIEDAGTFMGTMMREPIRHRYMAYLSFLERTLPAEGDQTGRDLRVQAAEKLCRAMGVMQGSANEVDVWGLTPLMRAVCNGVRGKVLRHLVAARADVNFRDAILGRTALCLAALRGHEDAVEALAQLRCDLEAKSEPGTLDATPLWLATANGQHAVIEVLAKHKADVNQTDKYGRTPVYIAAVKGHTAAVEVLGRLGADVRRADDEEGFTPLGIALHRGHTATADVLKLLESRSPIARGP